MARYAVAVDDKPLTELDRKINRLTDRVKVFAQYSAAGFAVAAAGAYKLVDAASHAEEKLNILRETFKGNAAEVEKWSRVTAAAMGRSEFTFQESVGQFGAFLSTNLKDANVDIAQMSERLSALAVDLASFYDMTDSEAIMKLFSGISGETEAVRRLGIDISDSALAALNKAHGDTRDYNTLTLPEKTMLRFQKIMLDTTLAQGDAVRTANQWAGTLKRVSEQMKTLAVRLGRVLKSVALPLLHTFEKFASVVGKALLFVVKQTSALETALALAAVAAGALAAKFVIMSLALPGMIPLLVAGLAAAAVSAAQIAASMVAFLVIEDVVTFLRGGDSILGSWLSNVTGLSRPLGLVEGAFERISISINNAGVRLQQMVYGTKALALAASGNIAGAVATSNDSAAYGNKYLIDSDAVQAKRGQDRELSFRAAVRQGGYAGLKEAATQFGRPTSSRNEEYQRALKMREDFVRRGVVSPTADDLKTFENLRTKAPLKSPIADYKGLGVPKLPKTTQKHTPAPLPGFQSITPGFDVQVPFNARGATNPNYGSVTPGTPVIIQKVEVNVTTDEDAEKKGRAFLQGVLNAADADAGQSMPETGEEDYVIRPESITP